MSGRDVNSSDNIRRTRQQQQPRRQSNRPKSKVAWGQAIQKLSDIGALSKTTADAFSYVLLPQAQTGHSGGPVRAVSTGSVFREDEMATVVDAEILDSGTNTDALAVLGFAEQPTTEQQEAADAYKQKVQKQKRARHIKRSELHPLVQNMFNDNLLENIPSDTSNTTARPDSDSASTPLPLDQRPTTLTGEKRDKKLRKLAKRLLKQKQAEVHRLVDRLDSKNNFLSQLLKAKKKQSAILIAQLMLHTAAGRENIKDAIHSSVADVKQETMATIAKAINTAEGPEADELKQHMLTLVHDRSAELSASGSKRARHLLKKLRTIWKKLL